MRNSRITTSRNAPEIILLHKATKPDDSVASHRFISLLVTFSKICFRKDPSTFCIFTSYLNINLLHGTPERAIMLSMLLEAALKKIISAQLYF